MSSSRLGVLVLALLLLTATLLGGCENTHQHLLAQGYPPAYADGFDDGCGSGRQAAGSISGEFRKDVPRYLREAIYASGWATASSNAGRWRGARSGGVSRNASGTTATTIGSATATARWPGPCASAEARCDNHPQHRSRCA